jgi:hypothetical protein
MSLVLADRVRETTQTTGTGTITLDGAVQGFQSFSVIGNNNTTYYTINRGSEWEVGVGTYYGGTLSRDTVYESSNSNNKVNFSAGAKDVFVTLPSEQAVTSGTDVTFTKVTTPVVQATNSSGLSLKNSAGTTQISMGGGGGDNISLNVSTNLNGTNAQIDISPTGTGHVHMKPTGSGSIEIAPTNVGTMDNITIGATTAAAGTFTEVDIPTNSGTAVVTKGTGITSWVYSGNSFSVTTQESTPTGLFFKPDGTAMYINGSTGDRVNQYSLSTPWLVTSATFVNFISVSAQDTSSQDVFFKPDGTTMFILGDTNNAVFQYTLSTAWDITTATYASKSFIFTTQDAIPVGLWFKPDGLTMYMLGATNDAIFQYTLSVAWDVSTATYANKSFSVATQETSGGQLCLSADGTKFWIIGSSGNDINEYTIGTAWDITTASFVNNVYIGFQELTALGLFIDSTANNRVYVVGSSNDTVYQYNTATNSLALTTDGLYTNGQSYFDGNLYAGANVAIDGSMLVLNGLTSGTTTINGTLSAGSTISLTGTTTSSASFATSQTTANTSICTSQTSGTFTLGGTSGTGTMTLGRSTVSQTTDFQAGATASGSTKTMNIGTAGVSGSTTAINIGSAVSGATSTTTLNGLVIDSISAAVSAAGSTQGTATALVSNINNVTVVAAAADGVRLPTAVAGMRILIRNSDAADILKIYPATSGQINALGANAAYSLVAGLTIELMATTATQWYTF